MCYLLLFTQCNLTCHLQYTLLQRLTAVRHGGHCHPQPLPSRPCVKWWQYSNWTNSTTPALFTWKLTTFEDVFWREQDYTQDLSDWLLLYGSIRRVSSVLGCTLNTGGGFLAKLTSNIDRLNLSLLQRTVEELQYQLNGTSVVPWISPLRDQ